MLIESRFRDSDMLSPRESATVSSFRIPEDPLDKEPRYGKTLIAFDIVVGVGLCRIDMPGIFRRGIY